LAARIRALVAAFTDALANNGNPLSMDGKDAWRDADSPRSRSSAPIRPKPHFLVEECVPRAN
jgi:hypothetical protein